MQLLFLQPSKKSKSHWWLLLRLLLVLPLQVDVDRARQQVSAGHQPAGILGSLVAAEDEHGNRWERGVRQVWGCVGAGVETRTRTYPYLPALSLS